MFPSEGSIKFASSILSQYVRHVRFLRIIVTSVTPKRNDNTPYQTIALETLKGCTSAMSLEIYYDDNLPQSRSSELDPWTASLNAEAFALITNSSLSSLAICPIEARVRSLWFPWPNVGISDLLQTIASRIDSITSLKVLDVTSDSLPRNVYDAIRSKATTLETLCFRNSLDLDVGRLWDEDQISKWAPNSNLTQLSFANCQSVYAPHLPHLVLHFTSLKYLIVSACGDNSDVEPTPRNPGWSREKNALRQRAPLEMMQIEHMLAWEILAMGIISTKTLIATSLVSGHLAQSFLQDEEIFPGLAILQTDNDTFDDNVTSNSDGSVNWRQILKRRRIELEGDAQWLINVQW